MPVKKPSQGEVIVDNFSSLFAQYGAALGQDPSAPLIPRERIIASIDGGENSGKTHFAGSVASSPRKVNGVDRVGVLYQCFDRKSLGTIEKFRNGTHGVKNIQVMDYSAGFEFPFGADEAAKSAISHAWFEQFRTHFYAALNVARSIIWDHAGAPWEMLRYARFGKLSEVPPLMYGPVNQEFEELIDRAYVNDCNLILLHRIGDEYENVQKTSKAGKSYEVGERTGNQKRKPAYKGVGYKVQAGIRIGFDPAKKHTVGYVTECQFDKTKEGTLIEALDFPTLASKLVDNVDPAAWV